MTYKIFPIDIFRRGVLVFIGSKEELLKEVERYGYREDIEKADAESESKPTSAVTYNCSSDVIIYSEKPIEDSVIVHETLHATSNILEQIDIYPCKETEELFAYLQEYLYSEISGWMKELNASSDDAQPP